MAAAAHPRSIQPSMRATQPTIGALRTLVLTTAALLAMALLIAIVLVGSLLLTGPWPTYDGGPWPQPVAQPTASEGLDL